MDYLLCKFPNPVFKVNFPKGWSKQKRVAFTRQWTTGHIDPEIKVTYKRVRDGAAVEGFIKDYTTYED